MLFCSFAAVTSLIGGAGYGDISLSLIGWSRLAGLPSPDLIADSASERPGLGILPVGIAVAFESGIRVGEWQSVDRYIEKKGLPRIQDSIHTDLLLNLTACCGTLDLLSGYGALDGQTVISTTTTDPGIEIGNEHSCHAGLNLQPNT